MSAGTIRRRIEKIKKNASKYHAEGLGVGSPLDKPWAENRQRAAERQAFGRFHPLRAPGKAG